MRVRLACRSLRRDGERLRTHDSDHERHVYYWTKMLEALLYQIVGQGVLHTVLQSHLRM